MIYNLNKIERKKSKILIVDDCATDRKLLACLCNQLGYEVILCENGYEAFDKANHELPDLILMDIMLPLLNGLDTLRMIRKNKKTGNIPVIILTSRDIPNDRIKGMEYGANDYINKPYNINDLTLRIKSIFTEKDDHDYAENSDNRPGKKAGEKAESPGRSLDQNRNRYVEAIQKLNEAVVYKDSKTTAHIRRFSLYCKEMALALGMDHYFVDTIHCAAPMHDLGKVGIPDAILHKQGRLTSAEWEVMKRHAIIGADILKGAKSPIMKMAAEIALSHHEKWNGSGYPFGLKGNEISLAGRIVSIADQYDALRSSRPYREGIGHNEATSIILKGCGKFSPEDSDPEMLNLFRKTNLKFKAIYANAN